MKSYGIILYTNINDKKYFLIYQRRDSNSFINLLRNSHKLLDDDIDILFNKLSSDEKNRLKTYSFQELWDDLFVNKQCWIYEKEKEKACNNFNLLKSKGFFDKHLDNGISQDLEWAFPKGRIKSDESYIECAFREFNEETSFNLDKKDVLFIGKYYNMRIHNRAARLYLCKSFKKHDIDYFYTKNMIRKKYISEETNDLKWITIDEADKYLDKDYAIILRSIDRNFT